MADVFYHEAENGRRDYACSEPTCNGIANCGRSEEDGCWYGYCRACGKPVVIEPTGCRMTVHTHVPPTFCETCDDD